MPTNIHDHAICESSMIGNGTSVGAFSRIAAGAVLGLDVTVDENVLITSDVVIGDRAKVRAGVQLWGAVDIESDVVVGPNVSFAAEEPDRDSSEPAARTSIGSGASIGAGTVILAGVRVGRKAVIAPGAVVTLDVPPYAIVSGNPAHVSGYIDENRRRLSPHPAVGGDPDAEPLASAGLVRLTTAVDMRGSLVALEFGHDFPFSPRRFFFVYGVPSRDVRGEHAHRECHQFLVCVNGSVKAVTDDGVTRVEHQLDSPSVGLYMPPMTWGTQYAYSPDAILVVFASHSYDPDDYIRDYSTFRNEAERAS